MSDTSFSAVNSGLERIQIYDDEWMMDSLSDDGMSNPVFCFKVFNFNNVVSLSIAVTV